MGGKVEKFKVQKTSQLFNPLEPGESLTTTNNQEEENSQSSEQYSQSSCPSIQPVDEVTTVQVQRAGKTPVGPNKNKNIHKDKSLKNIQQNRKKARAKTYNLGWLPIWWLRMEREGRIEAHSSSMKKFLVQTDGHKNLHTDRPL